MVQQLRVESRGGPAAGRDINRVIRVGVVRGNVTIVQEQAEIEAMKQMQLQLLTALADIQTQISRKRGRR